MIRRPRPKPITYTQLHSRTRTSCDDCLVALHAHRGHGALPQPVRWTRTETHDDGTRTVARLCGAHKHEREMAETKTRKWGLR